MKKNSPLFYINRIGWSLVFGLTLSYPYLNYSAYPLVWIAYIPLLYVTNSANFKSVAFYGFIGGMTLFATGNYWILEFIKTSKGIAGLPAMIMAVSVWIYCAAMIVVQITLYEILRKKTRLPEILLFPIVISTTLHFYPMMFELHLVDSQIFFPLVLQLLPEIGLLGMDAMIALVNVSLFLVLKRALKLNSMNSRSNSGISSSKQILLASAIVGVFFLSSFGANYFRKSGHTNFDTTIGIIQPNQKPILGKKSQPMGYSLGYPPEMEMTEKLAEKGAELVIWPEGRHKFYLDDKQIAQSYQRQIKQMGISLVFQDFKNLSKIENKLRTNTAIYLDSSETQRSQTYDKVKLIPFGEMLPSILSDTELGGSVRSLLGDFFAEIQAGESFNYFRHEKFTIIPLICFETTDANFVKRAVANARKNEPDMPILIVAMSNDGWFNSSHQAQQHIYPSALRAIENQLTLIHVANNGPSILVRPSGSIEILSKYNELTFSIHQL